MGSGRGTLADLCMLDQNGSASLEATIRARDAFILDCFDGTATYGEFATLGDVELAGTFSLPLPAGEYLLRMDGLVDSGETAFSLRLSPDVGTDCDGNGINDKEQIGDDPTLDRNRNLVLDACENPLVFEVPAAFATITEAIAAAQDGDIIRIAGGVYAETVDFSGKAIIIEGDASNPAAVVLDGASLDEPIVRADSGESGAVLRGVTLRNGRAGSPIPGAPSTRAGGGFYAWETVVTVEDCVFEANAATLGGGAFCRMGTATFRRCTFVLNECGAYGGGLNLSRCEGAVIEDCIFADNTAGASGGGFHAFGGSPVLTGCTFQTNLAQAPGGGLSWDSGNQGPALLENSSVLGNTSLTGGGGVATLFGTTPAINVLGTEICGNDPDQITGGFVDLGGNDICQCLADLSGDGQVNGTDLGLWLTYTLGPCDPKTPCPADLDGDGVIAGGDLGALLAAWGPCAN
jgi:hypothetical protein